MDLSNHHAGQQLEINFPSDENHAASIHSSNIEQINNFGVSINNSVSNPEKNSKSIIEDFGEKFGGAKKDYFNSIQELQRYSDKELIYNPLSNTLPHPNYKELSNDGIASPKEIATLRYLRDRLNPKPSPLSYQYKINKWLDRVNLYKDYYKSLSMDDYLENNGHMSSDVILQNLDQLERNQLESFTKTILGLGFPGKNVNLSGYEIRQFDNNGFVICLNSRIIKKNLSWNQAIETLNNIIEKKHKTFKIDFFQSKEDKTFSIGKRLPLQDIILASGFKTKREAVSYAQENLNQLEEKFNAIKLDPKERRENNQERIGKDNRNGKDISPEIFCKTFDFRGVEFGNWVQNKERQTALNNAYDSFMDLALITNIPPQAISLNGKLGIAFGSRGSGLFSAHYEPQKVVINLTKTRGAGSLAHEWWHALDNSFSRKKDQPLDYITENHNQPDDHIRDELITTIKNITTSIRHSNLRERSLNLDSTRTKPYWSTVRELTARCFENWVVSKLKEKNIENDYLANFRTPEEWSNNLQTDRNYPYPTREESESMNKCFQELFDTVQSKLDNNGHTILFRESGFKSTGESQKEELITEKELIVNTAKENGVYLKTPNGKPTNLSEEQWVQVRTKAFKEWFGDWENNPASASKVVDANGEPLVVYHGTDREFFTFNHDRFAKNGFYFTQSIEAARTFKEGKYVAEVFLDIKNPIKMVYAPVISKKTIGSGYDGIISKITTMDIDAPGFIVIHPNQIKSATHNIGTYRNNDNDIRFNIIGEKGSKNDPAIQNNLAIAISMEQAGKPSDEIFIATGWEKTHDNNQWKYDLHAEDIKFLAAIKGSEYYGQKSFSDQLDRIIDYPTLFKCYPEIRTMEVHFEQSENSDCYGQYHDGKIFINTKDQYALSQLSTLIHEIQHAIQKIEGFAEGGNISMFKSEYERKYSNLVFSADIGKPNPTIEDIKSYYNQHKENYSFLNLKKIAQQEGYTNIADFINSFSKTPSKQYYNLAGEVEARNASSRLNMPERERSMNPISYTEDVTETNKIYLYNKNEISNEIDNLSKILNTPVEKVYTRQELPDHIQEKMNPALLYSGLYDINNNKVYAILNEINDVREAQSTMLHEILGHKGLLALFKNKQSENDFFQKIWDIIPPKERTDLYTKYKDKKVGAEEYMARFAENYKEPKVWEKVKAIVKDFFRKLGIELKLTDVDLKNILYKAKQNLQQNCQQSINSKPLSYSINI